MTNEIEILELEDVDMVEGSLALRIGGVELKHVFYFADDEYMKKEGTVGSIHNVLLQFHCLQVQAEDSGRTGVISSGHGNHEYDCFGKVLGTGQNEGKFYFLLECGANIEFPCQIRNEDIEKDIKVGMIVKATGYFVASFVDSEIWKVMESIRAEWEALTEEEKKERRDRMRGPLAKSTICSLPSLLKPLSSIITRFVRHLFSRKQ